MPTYSVPAAQTQGEDPIIEAAKNFMQSPGYARQFMGNLEQATAPEAPAPVPSNQPGHIGGPVGVPGGWSDRDILAAALTAEAASGNREDAHAVGNVIMNRVRSPQFPGSVRDVVLQPGQISAFNNVTGYAGGEGANDLWLRPQPQHYELADTLLGGAPDMTGGALNYYNAAHANPKWGGPNFRQLPGTVHVFGTAGR